MAGDVNLFLNHPDDRRTAELEASNCCDAALQGAAEGLMQRRTLHWKSSGLVPLHVALAIHAAPSVIALQIMIAEPACRGKGLAKEAVAIMIVWAAESLVGMQTC